MLTIFPTPGQLVRIFGQLNNRAAILSTLALMSSYISFLPVTSDFCDSSRQILELLHMYTHIELLYTITSRDKTAVTRCEPQNVTSHSRNSYKLPSALKASQGTT